MATTAIRLQPIKLPALPATTSSEQRYWRSFRSPLVIREYASINHISFSPQSPYDFAIASSALVKIFSSSSRAVSKTISRFKDTVYSPHVRRDGRTLVAGDASGRIQIFDLSSRAILRTWNEHRQPVQVTRWSPTDLTTLLSASDDTTVRLWDLPSAKSITALTGHGDYVRTAAFLPNSPVIVSGGYDGCIKLFDPRAESRAVLTFCHPAPVEVVLPMLAGTMVLAASGPNVYVWDIVAAKLVTTLQNHQKTITALGLTTGLESKQHERRVLTGGLDGHVKIYDPTSWKVTYGIKYPSPVLAIGVAPDEKNLVVGMVGGLLSIRTRTSGREKHRLKEKERALDLIAAGLDPRPTSKCAKGKENLGNKKRQLKGMGFKGEGVGIVVSVPQKMSKERGWEKDLRNARYSSALDRVLQTVKDPKVVVTCLAELRYRNALTVAIQNRDEDGLRPLVEWVSR